MIVCYCAYRLYRVNFLVIRGFLKAFSLVLTGSDVSFSVGILLSHFTISLYDHCLYDHCLYDLCLYDLPRQISFVSCQTYDSGVCDCLTIRNCRRICDCLKPVYEKKNFPEVHPDWINRGINRLIFAACEPAIFRWRSVFFKDHKSQVLQHPRV